MNGLKEDPNNFYLLKEEFFIDEVNTTLLTLSSLLSGV
jgi:hypothetical protein